MLTSHILTSLTEICDEIIVLADGKVLRYCSEQEFGELSGDLLSALHEDKLHRQAELLPVMSAV